jgi:hypothetical protein
MFRNRHSRPVAKPAEGAESFAGWWNQPVPEARPVAMARIISSKDRPGDLWRQRPQVAATDNRRQG